MFYACAQLFLWWFSFGMTSIIMFLQVWYTAFQELGPFIATFANSRLSGLKIKDGQVTFQSLFSCSDHGICSGKVIHIVLLCFQIR